MKPRYLMISAIFVIMILYYSCTSAQFAPSNMNVSYEQRTQENNILIFRTDKPKYIYVEIGTIDAKGSSDTNILISLLRKLAAENGGDALIELEAYPTGLTATLIRFVE